MNRTIEHIRYVLLTVGAVFIFTSLVLVFAGVSPLDAYYYILKGSLGSWSKFAHVVAAWIPLVLCSAGLVFTFRIGLWNIGVEGQMMIGAVFTTLILRFGIHSKYPSLFIFLALAGSIAGGGLWAVIAGFLKTKGGVNEIFAGLGLNFVAQGMILWLIFGPWKRPGIASMSGTEVFPGHLWLSDFSFIRISSAGWFIALFAILFTWFVMRYVKFGLRLKAIGGNQQAAFLFGLNPGRYMIAAMLFAGGLAGLAGGIQVAGKYHRLLPAISGNNGYLALLVVMLAGYDIWASVAVAFLFACLNTGSIQLPMMLEIDSSLSGVIQGTLILAALAVQSYQARRYDRKKELAK